MSIPVNDARHLSEYDLKALKEGALHDVEILAFSEHMSNCRLCAGKFAASFAENELLTVPSGFEENIAVRLEPGKEDRKQLFFYSIKVAVAACATLIFVFSGAINFFADLDSKIEGYQVKGQYVADVVNTGFQDFSKKIFYLEVFVNENEKK